MKIKLDIDETRKNINSAKSFDELLKEWGDVVSDQYKEKFALALKNRDIIEAVSLISRAMYKRPHYSYKPFKLSLVVKLHEDFENAVNNTKIDEHLSSILSNLDFQELTFEDDRDLYTILIKSTWPIYNVKVDTLILSKSFMSSAPTRLGIRAGEVVDRCFEKSEIKKVMVE